MLKLGPRARLPVFALVAVLLVAAVWIAQSRRGTTADAVTVRAAPLVRTLQFSARVATLSRVDDGVVLDQAKIKSESFNLEATGAWRGEGAGRGTLDGVLVSNDVQKTLARIENRLNAMSDRTLADHEQRLARLEAARPRA